LRKTCYSLVCDNRAQYSAWNFWKFTWNFWNCEAPSFTNFVVNILNKIITHYRRPADHFALHREHLFARQSSNILHHCLAVPSLITFWP
jgi:hypothetical protein